MNDTPKKPLRVVFLYSSGHFGSTVILNRLMKLTPEIEVVGLIRAPAMPTFSKFIKHYVKIGWQFSFMLLWQRIIQGIALLLSGIIPLSRKRLTPGWLLCLRHNIPKLRCNNINDLDAVSFIKSLEPDIIVSAYFSQILKEPILNIPRKGCINVHPGYLPEQRGAMNYFWVLANNIPYTGVSLHWMDSGIDTGPLLARRRLPISPHATQQQIMVYTAIVGAKLLRQLLQKLYNNTPLTTIPTNEKHATYYPMPTKKDFKRYIKHKRFFRSRDIIRFVLREIR